MISFELLEPRYFLSVAGLDHQSAALPAAAVRAETSVVGNIAVIANPTSQNVALYNAVAGTWTPLTLPYDEISYSMTSVNDKIIFAGGLALSGFSYSAPTNTVDIYDISTKTWSTAGLSEARSGIVALSVGDMALFAGGLTSSGLGNPSNVVDIYSAATDKWTTATLSEAGEPKAAVVGDKAYFFFSDALDIYDSSTGLWSSDALSAYDASGAMAVAGAEIVFAGGAPATSPSSAVSIYDTVTNHWSGASLSAPRMEITAIGAGNLAIFAGGWGSGSSGSQVSNAVDIYNAATDSWTTSSLLEPEVDLSGTVVGDKVVFAGGDTGTSLALIGGHVDIYDAVTGQWSSTTLSVPRNDVGAVTVDSTALFAGGNTDNDTVLQSNAVDLFTALPTVEGNLGRGARGGLRVTVHNNGDAALPANDIVQIYASTSSSNRGAVLLGSVMLGDALAAGDSTVLGVTVSVPRDLAAGNYHLFAAIAPPTRGQVTIFATYANAFTIAGADVAASGLPRAESANRAGLPFSVTPIADGADSTVSVLGSAGANILE